MGINPRGTQLVALLSFVTVILYYQSTSTQHLPHPGVQIKEKQSVNEKVSPDDLEDDITLHVLQLFEGEEIVPGSNFSELPSSSPLPSSPSPPPSARPASGKLDLEQKSVWSTRSTGYLPVLKPSNGSFLNTLDISGFRKKEKEFLKVHLETLRQRATLLSNECESRPHLANPGALNSIWDTKHTPNVIWCPNYKVASTTWAINFLRLAHFNDDNPDLLKLPKKKRDRLKYTVKYGARQTQLYKLFPPPSDKNERERVFKNSLRMIVVRHPFSRLISAYRDKMQKMDPKPEEHKFRDLQLHIISKYRKKDSKNTSPFPTFPEFIQYVIDSTEKLRTRSDWITNVKCWVPYWAHCNVCAADYNLIMKMETLNLDQKFLTTIANMTELKELESPEWRHLHNGTSSDDLMKTYRNQLTQRQALQITQRYLLDYFLFGYNPEDDLLDYI